MALVQTTVTAQTAGLPARHGMSVMPSGRFPSVRLKPAGSMDTGMPAAENSNHIVKSVVASSFARCLLTDKTVQAAGVNWCSAAALMRDADVEAQA